jgi:hypothetical protein
VTALAADAGLELRCVGGDAADDPVDVVGQAVSVDVCGDGGVEVIADDGDGVSGRFSVLGWRCARRRWFSRSGRLGLPVPGTLFDLVGVLGSEGGGVAENGERVLRFGDFRG